MRPELLDLLGLLLVEMLQVAAGVVVDLEQFIELRLHRLHVPVLGALDEERHNQRHDRQDSMPIEGLVIEDQPQPHERGDYEEGGWAREKGTGVGEEVSMFHAVPTSVAARWFRVASASRYPRMKRYGLTFPR